MVSFDPLGSVRKANANGTIQEGLCTCSWHSVLAWQENLAVQSTNLMTSLKDLLKNTCRCLTGNGGVKAKCVRWVSKLVRQIVEQTMAWYKLERRECTNICEPFMGKFDSKVMPKNIQVVVGNKCWAETISADDCGTN